jgi:hypothetical protein
LAAASGQDRGIGFAAVQGFNAWILQGNLFPKGARVSEVPVKNGAVKVLLKLQ